MTIKEKFMNEIMENQFKNMTSEEKKQMMEAMEGCLMNDVSKLRKRYWIL